MYYESNTLTHHGVKGMRWGVRRDKTGYSSTSLKAARARRQNAKVDAGFKDWEENAKKKDRAIELGKKANAARMAYERDPSDKSLKSAYKTATSEYKKALSENTTYRKGAIRKEVGQDISRKYLSEAKKIQKQLTADPSNKDLQKKYNDLMSKHDIERASSRKAASVGQKRSTFKATIKRSMTMTAKAAVGTAAVAAGAYAVNRYLNSHEVTLNGKRVNIGTQTISNIVGVAKKVKSVMGFVY
jgi:hypothetical protein